MPKHWDGKTLPDALAAAATDAAKRAAVGSRRAVYLQTVQSRIGAGAARETWRDGVKVREAVLTGVLPISGLRIDVPAPTSEQMQGAVALLRPDNEPAEIVHYIRSAVNPGSYVAIPVGGPTAATPGRLVSDLASGQPMTYAAMTLEPPPLDGAGANPTPAAVTLTGLAATSASTTSASVSVVVGGTIPPGARVLLQVTADPANGPWIESDRPAAVTGTFTRVFPGLTSNTPYYTRAFVFTDNGGPNDVIHATTALVSFTLSGATFERVMVIGDSISNGSQPGDPYPYFSWRGRFQELMTAGGRAHDMIGPNASGVGGGVDPQCAAWGGAAIDAATDPGNNIDSRLTAAGGLAPTIFTAGVDPTLVILFVGWNEMWVDANAATAPTRFNALLTKIRGLAPNAKFVVCTLHKPLDGSSTTRRTTYNNTVRAAATANPDVIACADLDTLALASTDFANNGTDYVHLSQAGADKVAQRIYDTVVALRGSVSSWLQLLNTSMTVRAVTQRFSGTGDPGRDGRIISADGVWPVQFPDSYANAVSFAGIQAAMAGRPVSFNGSAPVYGDNELFQREVNAGVVWMWFAARQGHTATQSRIRVSKCFFGVLRESTRQWELLFHNARGRGDVWLGDSGVRDTNAMMDLTTDPTATYIRPYGNAHPELWPEPCVPNTTGVEAFLGKTDRTRIADMRSWVLGFRVNVEGSDRANARFVGVGGVDMVRSNYNGERYWPSGYWKGAADAGGGEWQDLRTDGQDQWIVAVGCFELGRFKGIRAPWGNWGGTWPYAASPDLGPSWAEILANPPPDYRLL